MPAHRLLRVLLFGQDNSVLVLEAGSPKFNDRNIKMPIAILRCVRIQAKLNIIHIRLPVHMKRAFLERFEVGTTAVCSAVCFCGSDLRIHTI